MRDREEPGERSSTCPNGTQAFWDLSSSLNSKFPLGCAGPAEPTPPSDTRPHAPATGRTL